MLALDRALMMQSRLLLLDEFSIGLAPRRHGRCVWIGRAAQERRCDDRMVEQNARVARAIADEGHVLETGRLVLSGPGSEPAQDPRIIETYLAIVVS
jgi:branched-chain amino acid transport system ATP-binding protein